MTNMFIKLQDVRLQEATQRLECITSVKSTKQIACFFRCWIQVFLLHLLVPVYSFVNENLSISKTKRVDKIRKDSD